MTDQDRFDRELGQRLAASEARVHGANPPDPATQREPDRRIPLAIGGILVAALIAGVVFVPRLVGDPVGQASPTSDPSASAAATEPATPGASPASPATASPTPTPTPEPTHDTSVPPAMTWTPRDAGGPEGVNDLAWLNGWIAVGMTEGRAGAWTLDSLTGTWAPAAPIDPPFVPLTEDVEETARSYWINDVVRLPSGLVAVGAERIGCCDFVRPAIWASSDGRSWSYLDQEGSAWSDAGHIPIAASVNHMGEVVAITSYDLGSGLSVWISEDGRTWEEHKPALEQFSTIGNIAAGGQGLLAVGERRDGQSRSARAWASTDGREWTQLSIPEEIMAFDAVEYDDATDRFILGGRTASGIALWTTPDGSEWSPALPLAAGEGTIRDLEAGGGLVVAVAALGPYDSAEWVAFSAWSTLTGGVQQVSLLGEDGGGGIGAMALSASTGEALIRVEITDPATLEAEVSEWAGLLPPP